MPSVSSFFLVLALILAAVIGPQTRPWTWGPAMLALGFSVMAALPVFWSKKKNGASDIGLLSMGALTVAWFAWRAWNSPVQELGVADLLLLGGALGSFVSIRAITGSPLAERILIWGIALLLLANVVVIGMQIMDPTFTPVFRERAGDKMVSGFFGHYNYMANFLIASSMIVGAAALMGRHATLTRILWLLIAIAGIAGVWFTRSRGGIFGAAAACGVFAALMLILGKRRNARWFGPALVALPLLGIGIGAFLWLGWQEAQEIRQAGSGIEGLMDNTVRLYFLGIAVSCIGLHPLAGGGSRSFSWECFQFWEKDVQGAGAAKPQMVHNELIQSATDYGLVGAGLLIGLLGTFIVSTFLRVIFEERPLGQDSQTADAWQLGGLAGLLGILVQSCFSFVFHLMPGVLLLGICLGQMSRAATHPSVPSKRLGPRILLGAAALATLVLLLPMGWKGTRVTQTLWPSYFSKAPPATDEPRIGALTAALRIWPQAELYRDRGMLYQTLAATSGEEDSQQQVELAYQDYQKASLHHPLEPDLAVNSGNLLSHLQRDDEAEASYERAIWLQGGMEAGFRGHFSLASHLLHKGLRLFTPDSTDAARVALEVAAEEIEKAVDQTPPWMMGTDGRNTRISIHESLGVAREANGDYPGALAAYDFATSIPGGSRAHYRAGALFGKMAASSWAKRKPSEAMASFMEANRRIKLATEIPPGVTGEQRNEYLAYLERTIAYFKGARIEPDPLPKR